MLQWITTFRLVEYDPLTYGHYVYPLGANVIGVYTDVIIILYVIVDYDIRPSGVRAPHIRALHLPPGR